MEDPYSATPYYNLGIVKSKLGDQKGALESYNRALTVNPMFGSAYLNRGNIYLNQGKTSAACDDYLQGKYNGDKGSFTNFSKFCETSKKDFSKSNKNSFQFPAFFKRIQGSGKDSKNIYAYPTKKEAEKEAKKLGCVGVHKMGQLWIPCAQNIVN